MLHKKPLQYAMSFCLFFSCVTAPSVHATVYKAVFPDGNSVNFQPKGSGYDHEAELDSVWFEETTGTKLITLDSDDLKRKKEKFIHISGGLLSTVEPDDISSLSNTVAYTLQLISAAMKTPGFDRILDKSPRFHPKTEQLLYIAVDTHNIEQTADVMRRVATLAEGLVQSGSILRWEPRMRYIGVMNQVLINMTLPKESQQNDRKALKEARLNIGSLFLNEFDTLPVTFWDKSDPTVSTMSRNYRLPPKAVNGSLSFTDRVFRTLINKGLSDMIYLPARTSDIRIDHYVIQMTATAGQEGENFIVSSLKKLHDRLRSVHKEFNLQLRGAEWVQSASESSCCKEPVANSARFTFHLAVFLPRGSAALVDEHSVLNMLEGNEDQVSVNCWQPIKIISDSYSLKKRAEKWIDLLCLPPAVKYELSNR